MKQQYKHPARYSVELLPHIAEWLAGCKTVFDPFAGTGERLADLAKLLPGSSIQGIEIERKYIVRWDYVTWGDATKLHYSNNFFSAAVSSPTYGNRLNDNYAGNDNWHYENYRACLGEPLAERSTAKYHFENHNYKLLHTQAWLELYRVLQPGAKFVLNVKDHIKRTRKGDQIVPVTQWHCDVLIETGFKQIATKQIECPGYRNGRNREKRLSYENLILFEKN